MSIENLHALRRVCYRPACIKAHRSAVRKKKRQARREKAAHLQDHARPDLEEALRKIVINAPERANGFRLLLPAQGPEYKDVYYPQMSNMRRLRQLADGTYTDEDKYRLNPPEMPVVPADATYEVFYYNGSKELEVARANRVSVTLIGVPKCINGSPTPIKLK
jgi:hypothetical protein